MNKAAFGIMAFLVVAAFCFVPAGLDAAGEITHDGTNVYKVSTTETFEIKYTLDEGDEDKAITYSAKVINKTGDTMSSAVTPSSGSLGSGEAEELDVKVPSTAGEYRLVVEFFLDDVKDSQQEYVFNAVNPIVLTVNLKADDVTLNLEEFGVYFYVDGEKQEDSFKTISLSANGTGSVSYDWIANPDKSVSHSFYVKAVGGSGMIQGLDEVHVFYAADDDYSLIIVVAFVLLVLLVFYAVRIYRKPVKNFGKPNSRR